MADMLLLFSGFSFFLGWQLQLLFFFFKGEIKGALAKPFLSSVKHLAHCTTWSKDRSRVHKVFTINSDLFFFPKWLIPWGESERTLPQSPLLIRKHDTFVSINRHPLPDSWRAQGRCRPSQSFTPNISRYLVLTGIMGCGALSASFRDRGPGTDMLPQIESSPSCWSTAATYEQDLLHRWARSFISLSGF